jgi:tetratricopeptide (TPR) repeat protein
MWTFRGLTYLRTGDFDKAISDLSEAIRLNPDDADNYDSRAGAYSEKEDWDNAIADLDKAIGLDPENIDVIYKRGIAFHHKGDYKKAITDYETVLQCDIDEDSKVQVGAVLRAVKGGRWDVS